MLSSFLATFRGLLSWTLTIVTLSLCAALARLAAAPVSLDGLAPMAEARIAERLAASAPGWTLRLGGLQYAWESSEQRTGLRLTGVRLFEPSGEVAFQAPAISVAFDVVAALDGRIEPQGVSILGAELVLARGESGEWRFALSGAQALADRIAPKGEEDSGSAMLDAAGEALTSEQGRADAARLIDALTGPRPLFGLLGDLQRISVVRAGVTYLDDLSGVFLRAREARLDLRQIEGGGLRLAVQTLIETDEPGAAAKISVIGERFPGAREAHLSVRFEDAPAAAIAAQFHELDALQAIEGYVSGEALASISLDDGDLLTFSASLRGEGAQFAAIRRSAEAALARALALAKERKVEGADSLRPPPSGVDPLGLSAFAATFDYLPETDGLALRKLEVTGDRLAAVVEGDARFLRDKKGAATGAEGALLIKSARILDPELFATPLAIDSGRFRFRLEGGAPGSAEAPKLWIEDLEVMTPEVDAKGSARVLFAPPIGDAAVGSVGASLGMRADLDLALSDFEATRLPVIWPLPAAPGGRDWVAENVFAGWIRDGKFKARIGGGAGFGDDAASDKPAEEAKAAGEAGASALSAKETIDFDFRFEGLGSRYLDQMTPVTAAAGTGQVEADRFDLKFEQAEVDLGPAGALSLDGSHFAITSFEPEFPPGEIRVRSDGPVRALLALIDQEPLALTRKIALDPAVVEGRVKGETRLSLPLKKDLPAKDVAIDAEGVLKELVMPLAQLGGARASAKRATVEVNGERLRLAGDAELEGYQDLSFDTEWVEAFSPKPGLPSTTLIATTRLSAERLTAKGAPDQFELEGSSELTLRYEDGDDLDARMTARLSLKDLAARLPVLGWSKRRGEAGDIEAEIRRDGERVGLPRIEMESAGLTAKATASLDDQGGLTLLKVSSLKTAGGTEMAADIAFEPDGAVSVRGGGKRLDLGGSGQGAKRSPAKKKAAARAGKKQRQAKKSAKAEPPLSVDLEFDRVTLADGPGLRSAKIVVARSEEGGLYGDLSAATGGGFVSASSRPHKGGARYKLDTDDFGGMLTALGLIDEAKGGVAAINAVESANGRIAGELNGKNLVIVSAPALADLLSAVSLVGLVDMMSTGGITFSTIEAPFVIGEEVMVIDQLTAKGPSIGLTAKGRIDHAQGVLDFDGSVSPAFVLNGLPGEIPVLGKLLTGGEGQGVIGFSFSMSGSLEDPNVQVNPLSALTPGPLRGIFGG